MWLVGTLFVILGQVVLLKTVGGSPSEARMQAISGSLLILGAGLFGAAINASPSSSRFDFSNENTTSPVLARRSMWVVGCFFVSIVAALLAIFWFITVGENTPVVVLWAAGILALLLGSIDFTRLSPPRLSKDWIYPAALTGLLVIAAIMRLYKLTTLPFNFDGDFASVGLEARALATGQQQHIFAFGWADIPFLGYMPPALTMMLFGDNLFGLNVSGVIEGLLIILGVYLLGRDLYHARVGLLAAALMTISYAHLAASRQATYIDPVLLLVYVVYFLLLGLREDRAWAIVLSGVLTALCIQVYYSGRMIVFVLAFLLLFLCLVQRSFLRTHIGLLGLWVLAAVIATGPMLIVFARNPNAFVSRSREVFILAPEVVRHMQGVYQVNTISAMMLQQVRHTLLLFHYYPDTGTQFGFRKPFLDPFSATLFTIGLGYALFHARKLGNSLMLAWTIIGLVLGCFLTVNPPFWARLMILLPPTMILAGVALDLIYQKVQRSFQTIKPRAAVFAPILTLLILASVGWINWNTYVDIKSSFATARTYIGRYLADQPAATKAYLVSNDFNYRDREFEFLIPGRLIASLTPEEVELNPPAEKNTLLILTAEQNQLSQQLQQRFPNGSLEIHTGNSPNEIAFYAFRMP